MKSFNEHVEKISEAYVKTFFYIGPICEIPDGVSKNPLQARRGKYLIGFISGIDKYMVRKKRWRFDVLSVLCQYVSQTCA